MDSSLAAYLPQDRRLALARGEPLPEHAYGVALFADDPGAFNRRYVIGIFRCKARHGFPNARRPALNRAV